MDVKELRIGNVIGDIIGAPVIVRAINNGGIAIRGEAWCIDASMLDPIKLTEEILLKCGFVAKSVYSNFVLGELELESCYRNRTTNERSCFYLDGNIPDFMKIRIDYLHQLQNLIYALTGEELNVSEIV